MQKAVNDVIDIFTSEDIENMLLDSAMFKY